MQWAEVARGRQRPHSHVLLLLKAPGKAPPPPRQWQVSGEAQLGGLRTITEHSWSQGWAGRWGWRRSLCLRGAYTRHSKLLLGADSVAGLGPRASHMISRTPASFCRGPEKLSHLLQVFRARRV